jgi:hypothetical protein
LASSIASIAASKSLRDSSTRWLNSMSASPDTCTERIVASSLSAAWRAS